LTNFTFHVDLPVGSGLTSYPGKK